MGLSLSSKSIAGDVYLVQIPKNYGVPLFALTLLGFFSISYLLLSQFRASAKKKVGMSDREQILETANQLFLLTSQQEWSKIEQTLLSEKVYLDMSTLGLKPTLLEAKDLVAKWKIGYDRVNAVFHACSNHHVSIDGNEATVKCNATTTHYKASAVHGMTRDFVGTYELQLVRSQKNEWRVNGFKFDLMFIMGNANLE